MTHKPSTHRQIKPDYLSGHPALKPFYSYDPQHPDFGQIMADKSFAQEKRKVLHKALEEQYEGLTLTDALKNNIDSLLSDHSYTLTTGHQLGLMGGPLFTVYKVLSTICLAEELNRKYSDKHLVPVFWIHTEDHDFEEINHFFEDFGKKLTYEGNFSTATGLHVLEESIRSLIPENFEEKLAKAWQTGKTLAEAYRLFFHELMGEHGLVILDASHPSLKALFRDVLEKELFHNLAHEAVGESSRKLEEAGYKLQVHPRKINLFYLDEEGRNRIEGNELGFEAVDRELKWSPQDMALLVQNHPERFSPNVSLRPLYQEIILPNLAYFGGWGELSYWMQLKGVFEAAGENFPLLLPRFSATLFPEDLLREWTELGLEADDIRKSQAEIFRIIGPRLWDDGVFREKQAEILERIEELREYIEGDISQTLANSAEALKVKTDRFINNLHKKAHRIIRHKHPELFEKVNDIKSRVNPDRMVQERIWSLAALDSEAGTFVRWVKQFCHPLELDHKILVLPREIGEKSEAVSEIS